MAKVISSRIWCWLLGGALLLGGCQTKEVSSSGTSRPVRKAKKTKVAPPPATTNATQTATSPTPETAEPGAELKVKYDPELDAQFESIFTLAKKNKWEEAEAQATLLYDANKEKDSVKRVYDWVVKQREVRRKQAVEDKIREIDANNSVFNPTVVDLFKEKKDRGLPARKDVRDAVEQIESTPYVPSSYGKSVHQQGELFDFASEQGRMAKMLEKEISVTLENVSLEHIIFNIGQANGINFVADKSLPAFKQTLSVNMQKAKLSEFLRYVSRNLGLQFQVGDDLIWIVDGKDPSKMMEETRFYRLRKGFLLPAQFGPSEVVQVKTVNPQGVITQVQETQKIERFVNDNVPAAPSLEEAIKSFFATTSTNAKYMIDYERNLVVARGTRDQLEVLERIIKEFDRPVQQVLIEARFVTVSQPAFMQLGVLWETGRDAKQARSATDFTGLISPNSFSSVGLGLQATFTNVLKKDDLSATISALEQTGESQTLSAPRLTVVNNRPATINDGKIQYYYEEYSVKTTILERSTSSSWVPQGKPAKLIGGVELDVLASIAGDGHTIMLALHPRVSQDVKLVTFATLNDYDSLGRVTSTFDIRLPESRTQELMTRVAVKSGETVVMGGVLEREQTTYVESVPVLGNIPILGALFRRRTEIDKPRYLLIFVTATLLSDSGEFIIYDEPEKK